MKSRTERPWKSLRTEYTDKMDDLLGDLLNCPEDDWELAEALEYRRQELLKEYIATKNVVVLSIR